MSELREPKANAPINPKDSRPMIGDVPYPVTKIVRRTLHSTRKMRLT